MAGWFHRNARRREILRYYHRGHEHAPVLALIRLCEALPDDPDWMDWYAAVTLWSEYYQKPLAAFTRPYGMLANSVWPMEEFDARPEAERASWRELAREGTDLGGGWYLRAIGVHPKSPLYRGNNGTLLTQAKALAAAAHLRGNLPAAQLCQEQLYWVLGRNPFCQSLMVGEGYDFPPMYSPRSGTIVGALPVGIRTLGTHDLPYWPATALCCYKEIWIHPVGRWIWLMGDMGGQPRVRGTAPAGQAVTFRQVPDGLVRSATTGPDGRFRLSLPAGVYEVTAGQARQTATLLPAGVYDLDLRPGRTVGLRIEHATVGGTVTITLHATGIGGHRFELRAHNLAAASAIQSVDLSPARPAKLVWQAKVQDPSAPWIALITPDGDVAQRREITGLVRRPGGK